MSFKDEHDFNLADRFLMGELSPKLEKEARAATRRALWAIREVFDKELKKHRPDHPAIHRMICMIVLLESLAAAFDPGWVPPTRKRAYPGKIHIRAATKGSRSAYAAYNKDLNIAHEVAVERWKNKKNPSRSWRRN